MKTITYYLIPLFGLVLIIGIYAVANSTSQVKEALLDLPRMTAKPEIGEEESGGATTVQDTGNKAFGRSPRNMRMSEWNRFFRGKSIFDRDWGKHPKGNAAAGPNFSALSCGGCHHREGRGAPPQTAQELSETMVFKLAVHGDDEKIYSEPLYGDQLDYYNLDGRGEGWVSVEYEEIEGRFADGTPYTLLDPVYDFKGLAYGPLHDDLRFSPRVAPVNFGLGLLEAIPESDILEMADPDDRDRNGISGRPNHVMNLESGRMQLGRFGWKGAQPTLRQQIARALNADIGVTTYLYSDGGEMVRRAAVSSHAPEMTTAELDTLHFYMKLIAAPARRNWSAPTVLRGKALFNGLGCDGCHRPRFTTEEVNGFPELSNQTIRPYTDLLLHDMGDGLADRFSEGAANGREWRTPPLWGIGLTRVVSGHTRFLHDGRARNIEEAILWHGGEAARTQDLYRRLRKEDRAALLAFLESL